MSERPLLAVGIDLGTTFSAVAYLDDLGRPQTLINAEGDKVTPSVVLFEGTDVVVGKEALKAVATDADLVAQCAKRELGMRMFQKALAGRQYPPEALEAWVLNKLRIDASRQIGSFGHVVITVPAYFDEVRRKATQDAGYMAGFEVLDIINEPTAAAVAFGFKHGFLKSDGEVAQRQRILVYDLGGGTFDVTVMEIEGSQFTALATDGDVHLGGHDWDFRLVDFVAEEFKSRFKTDPREEPNTRGRLWRECEDAKRTLSARSKAFVACDYQGHAFRIEITRKKFEELTKDLLDRTAFTTRQTLQAAGLEWGDLDHVLMVGGSTRMPMVTETLRGLSGKEPNCSVSADEAVAHGAALRAGIELSKSAGERPQFRIRNVNSHSLGVVATDSKTKRKRTAILIPRNTTLPVTAKRIFKTQKADQKSILVQIVEGESASPDDCTQIGRCSVRPLPRNLPAQTPIEVRFSYGEDGRLTVLVMVAGTDITLRHEITRENSLTPDQLDSWREYISGVPKPSPKRPAADDDVPPTSDGQTAAGQATRSPSAESAPRDDEGNQRWS
jgi:molecular chaperone DnaK